MSKNWKKETLTLMENNPDFIVFDLETTGRNPNRNKIIQCSAIKMHFNSNIKRYEEAKRMDVYIRPSSPIPKDIEELTGITNEFIKEHQKETKVFPVIYEFFKDCKLLIGYNIVFDIGFMRSLYERNDEQFPSIPYIDVYRIAKDQIPTENIENHKLCSVATYLGLNKNIKFHSAISDVLVTLKIFNELYIRYTVEKETTEEEKEIYKEAVKKEKELASKGKEIVTINSMNYWEMPMSEAFCLKRIYMSVSGISKKIYGTVYYDLNGRKFCEKDKGFLSLINTEKLKEDADRIANSLGVKNMEKFKGSYKRIG